MRATAVLSCSPRSTQAREQVAVGHAECNRTGTALFASGPISTATCSARLARHGTALSAIDRVGERQRARLTSCRLWWPTRSWCSMSRVDRYQVGAGRVRASEADERQHSRRLRELKTAVAAGRSRAPCRSTAAIDRQRIADAGGERSCSSRRPRGTRCRGPRAGAMGRQHARPAVLSSTARPAPAAASREQRGLDGLDGRNDIPRDSSITCTARPRSSPTAQSRVSAADRR
jgi:hypothetical protein